MELFIEYLCIISPRESNFNVWSIEEDLMRRRDLGVLGYQNRPLISPPERL